MLLLIQYTLIFASVLMLVALGGCFPEHGGIINIGLEGIMVIGALGGALMMKYLPAGITFFLNQFQKSFSNYLYFTVYTEIFSKLSSYF